MLAPGTGKSFGIVNRMCNQGALSLREKKCANNKEINEWPISYIVNLLIVSRLRWFIWQFTQDLEHSPCSANIYIRSYGIAIDYRYIATKYNTILHTAQKLRSHFGLKNGTHMMAYKGHNMVTSVSVAVFLNPLRAKFFRENLKTYIYILCDISTLMRRR